MAIDPPLAAAVVFLFGLLVTGTKWIVSYLTGELRSCRDERKLLEKAIGDYAQAKDQERLAELKEKGII